MPEKLRASKLATLPRASPADLKLVSDVLEFAGYDAKAWASGSDGYFTKPIDTRKLPRQVAGWLTHLTRKE